MSARALLWTVFIAALVGIGVRATSLQLNRSLVKPLLVGLGAGVLVASWTIAAVQALGDGRSGKEERRRDGGRSENLAEGHHVS